MKFQEGFNPYPVSPIDKRGIYSQQTKYMIHQKFDFAPSEDLDQADYSLYCALNAN